MKVGFSLVGVNCPVFLNQIKTAENKSENDCLLVANCGVNDHNDMSELKDIPVISIQRASQLCEMQNMTVYTNCSINKKRLNNQGIRAEVI